MMNSILFFIIIAFANTVSGIVGFGANILALPLLSLIMDVKIAVPVLLVTVFFNCTPRIIKDYKDINLRIFLSMLPLSVIGGFIGVFFVSFMNEGYLKLCLSLLMIFIGMKGILEYIGKWQIRKKDRIHPLMLLFPLCGGIMHGAFASGGPLYNIYILLNTDKKEELRVTQYAIGVTTSIFVFIGYLQEGMYQGLVLNYILFSIPAIILAIIVSETIFKRLDNKLFKKLLSIMLIIAGIIAGIQAFTFM